MSSLTFLGAARTVTGSKHLLEVDGQRILFDCGLFQGLKELRLRNWAPLSVPPDTIDAVVLTHAHIDHCGWLPRLISQGFRGRVHCTGGTADLCQLVLPDAAHIQEEDAKFANKRGFSKHAPALPLYTEEDAAEALSRLKTAPFNTKISVIEGTRDRVHQRRSPAGLVLRARDAEGQERRPHPVRRRSRALLAADSSRSFTRRRSRRAADRIDLRRSHSSRRKTTARRSRGSSPRRSPAAAR